MKALHYKKTLPDLTEKLRLGMTNSKDQSDENHRLTEEVKRLEKELQLQRDRTSSDEVIMLRNKLRLAMEAEENANQAMDELASVIKEVAAEANLGKEKLASAEEQIQNLEEETVKLKTLINSKEEAHNVALWKANRRLDKANKENETLNNTIDRLRAEAEESFIAWSIKEIEFVKLIKEEEDEKASVLEENHKLFEALTKLGQKSDELREETEKLRDVFNEALNEADVAREAIEEAKAEKLQLKAYLAEKERKLAILTQETERLRVYEDAAHENIKGRKRPFPSSPKKESKSPHKVEEEPKKAMNEHESLGVEEEQKKSVNELKSNEEEEELKNSVDELKSNETEEEQKNPLPSSSKDESKSGGVEEKEKRSVPSSSKKEAKSSHGEQFRSLIPSLRRIRRDSSVEKDLKGHGHTTSYGAFCFAPKVMLPLPGLMSKTKEVGDLRDEEDDDNIRDSIFDVLNSPPSLQSRSHRRTVSSSNDDKSPSFEEFEHEERPHFDDMEVERVVGSHSTKKRVLLWRFGDLLWKKSHHPQPHQNQNQNHQNQDQNQNLHQEVTT